MRPAAAETSVLPGTAYDAAARAYRDATAALPTHLGPVTGEWGRVLGAGARVLQIGSGSGRDAAALDPVVDDLADPADPDRPWDGVWAALHLLARGAVAGRARRRRVGRRPAGAPGRSPCRPLARRRRRETLLQVRYTEFWDRLEQALGPVYYKVWADQQVIGELDGRTPKQALDAGEDPRRVWRAVWAVLELPDRDR